MVHVNLRGSGGRCPPCHTPCLHNWSPGGSRGCGPTLEPGGIAEEKNKKKVSELDRGIEPDVNRTRNLLIWSQTRYHCATDPTVTKVPNTFI
jgi:hypothetical protein